MTARTPSRGRPKRDRRIHLKEEPTDSRDLRKLARAFIALARAQLQAAPEQPSTEPELPPEEVKP